ncbi:uncharacterized protein LOC108113660 isoform X2 [Drosophila eugracilis]|uniref:uncharacterized protein LOC108113660 isoform X2 n=1 Tax=Drosophila eugracilis TaxID=29029 RepID=UPI0007E61D99|nr:uncharacterized protein LOC108113660 isoform X2 [Drosophila eugracilis]
MFMLSTRVHAMRNSRLFVGFCNAVQPFHLSVILKNYKDAATIPLPINVDAAEATRSSPQRSRDISSTVIPTKASISNIDITVDNSFNAVLISPSICQERHTQSYDCFGLISLNSAMQSNVPKPFGGFNKYSHLNMPGGQWSQEYKFLAQNMHYSHYSSLRNMLREDWANHDKCIALKSNKRGSSFMLRNYSSQTTPSRSSETSQTLKKSVSTGTSEDVRLGEKRKLKQAIKEYGAVIVVFHVGISLISLCGFYALVYSGINFVPVLEFLEISSQSIKEKVATGSTFIIAYAVHKVFAPARISITLGSVPFLIRYLRSKGFQIPGTKHN